MKNKLFIAPSPKKMKKIISVCIIFVFLLMPFTGCGKLKNSPVSGLNQSEASNPPEVVNQPEASNPPEVVNQPEASNPPEVVNQPEASNPPEVVNQPEASNPPEVVNQPEASNPPEVVNQPEASNPPEVVNQPEASNPPEVVNQPEASNPPEVVNQSETSSEVDAKDLMEKESWKEWTCRQWNDNKGKWIGSISVSVVAFFIGYYILRTPAPAPLEISNPDFLGFFQPNAWGEFFIYDS